VSQSQTAKPTAPTHQDQVNDADVDPGQRRLDSEPEDRPDGDREQTQSHTHEAE
jgi:hypothetical protein